MAKAEVGNSISKSAAKSAATESVPSAKNKKGPDKGGFYWATGRRKCSVARVRIKPGDGKLIINKKELTEYFKKTEKLADVKLRSEQKAWYALTKDGAADPAYW